MDEFMYGDTFKDLGIATDGLNNFDEMREQQHILSYTNQQQEDPELIKKVNDDGTDQKKSGAAPDNDDDKPITFSDRVFG